MTIDKNIIYGVPESLTEDQIRTQDETKLIRLLGSKLIYELLKKKKLEVGANNMLTTFCHLQDQNMKEIPDVYVQVTAIVEIKKGQIPSDQQMMK